MKTLYATSLCVLSLVMSSCEQPYQITASGSAPTATRENPAPLSQPSAAPSLAPLTQPSSLPTAQPISSPPPAPTETPTDTPTPQPVITPAPVVTQSPTPMPLPVVTASAVPLPVQTILPTPTLTIAPAPVVTQTPVLPQPVQSPCVQISQVTEDVRVMLMVDNSLYTQSTDPDHAARVAAIDNFISTYADKKNLTYSYGCFATKAYIYNMRPGGSFLSNTGFPFGDVREARAALDMFKTIAPHGVSNYKNVFARLQEAIVSDVASTGGKQQYVVVFMSAGKPNDLGQSSQSQIQGITALVNDALQAAGPGRLSISTVFIGNPRDQQAINNLKAMATLGGGQFVGANSNQTVKLNDIINVPGQCPVSTAGSVYPAETTE